MTGKREAAETVQRSDGRLWTWNGKTWGLASVESEVCEHKGNLDESGNCHDCQNTGFIGNPPAKAPVLELRVDEGDDLPW